MILCYIFYDSTLVNENSKTWVFYAHTFASYLFTNYMKLSKCQNHQNMFLIHQKKTDTKIKMCKKSYVS